MRITRRLGLFLLTAGMAGFVAAGCSTPPRNSGQTAGTNDIPLTLSNAVQSVKVKFAPDPHQVVFKVQIIRDGGDFTLKGDVEDPVAKTAAVEAAAKAGFKVKDRIDVLPDPRLGDKLWAIATLSVVNVREQPENPAEMGTQILCGDVFKVWKEQSNWFLVQSADRYVGYAEDGGFYQCTKAEADQWMASPLLIVTNYEERILEKPDADAAVVSDLVMGGRVKRLGESGAWYHVGLADGRFGYIPKTSATDYGAWRKSRHPTAENIERTARSFLGRPYSWGGNSIRGLDCSGLTKFVFFLNGIDLNRNANEQCLQGVNVPLDDDFKHLKKGDLLFFGHRARGNRRERVDHTAIYLGNKLFIQASELVRISSLDRQSPLADRRRIRGLICARRILPDN